MPYINQDKRHVLDPHIAPLINALRELESDDPSNNMEGNLNYIITVLVKRTMGAGYRGVNDAVGMLECCKLELYRKVAASYEDQKEFENGAVE